MSRFCGNWSHGRAARRSKTISSGLCHSLCRPFARMRARAPPGKRIAALCSERDTCARSPARARSLSLIPSSPSPSFPRPLLPLPLIPHLSAPLFQRFALQVHYACLGKRRHRYASAVHSGARVQGLGFRGWEGETTRREVCVCMFACAYVLYVCTLYDIYIHRISGLGGRDYAYLY